MELSVIIPAYNEEQRISNTLKESIAFLKTQGYESEIIVVDDGSTDNTRQKVMEFSPYARLTPVRKNKGKGYSVKEGMLFATKKWRVFMDADNSTSIKEISNFFRHLDGNDILIGSRNLPDSVIAIKQPFLRSTLGKIFPLFVRLFAVRGIKDTQCGFKLFSEHAAKKIFPLTRLNRWGFDVEILFLARKKGFQIKEMPITWKNDGQSKVSPLKDSLDMFFDLLRIRWNWLTNKYEEKQ